MIDRANRFLNNPLKEADEKNVYQCPAGHEAPFIDKSQVWRSGNEYLTEYRYRMNVEHCRGCPLKDRCLGPTAKSRTIKRLEGSELTEAKKTNENTAA